MRHSNNGLAKVVEAIFHPLRIETADSWQKINYANTKGVFGFIQSIPKGRAVQALAGQGRL